MQEFAKHIPQFAEVSSSANFSSANCVRLLQPCLADAFDSFRDIQPELSKGSQIEV